MSFPAFKEWQVIVEALGSGEQALILRKGGIAEGKDGFQLKEKRFWLFPTHFHAQTEKTKSAAQKWFRLSEEKPVRSNGEADTGQVTLNYFAEVFAHRFIDDWETLQSLDRFHFWTETTIRERFEWRNPPGLHAFVLRVRKIGPPLKLAVTGQMAGCKSWIELPYDFDTYPSEPVISDRGFADGALTRLVEKDPRWTASSRFE